MKITAAQLASILPNNPNAAAWEPILNDAMKEFGIDANHDRIAAFVAQIAHESGELRRLVESLKYTTAKGICATWPDRFPTEAQAAPFVSTKGVNDGKDRALANRVYGGRLGNGDAASDEGWKFRGRGLIQTTGRGNYEQVGKMLKLNLVANPDLLTQPIHAARSAGYFWQSRGLNAYADDFSHDDDDSDFKSITKLINGGTKGLLDRRTYWAKARKVLGLSAVTP